MIVYAYLVIGGAFFWLVCWCYHHWRRFHALHMPRFSWEMRFLAKAVAPLGLDISELTPANEWRVYRCAKHLHKDQGVAHVGTLAEEDAGKYDTTPEQYRIHTQ